MSLAAEQQQELCLAWLDHLGASTRVSAKTLRTRDPLLCTSGHWLSQGLGPALVLLGWVNLQISNGHLEQSKGRADPEPAWP